MKRMRTAFNHLAVIGRRFGACGSSGASAEEPPAPFVGAFDDYASGAVGMWSLGRRMLSSYTGPLIRLRREPDQAESDFTYDADGNLDTVAIANFVGPFDAFVVKVYDQSGNANDYTQSTAGQQPKLVSGGSLEVINSAPKAGGVSANMTATNTVTGAFTLYMTGRNGQSPQGLGSPIIAVGDPFSEFLAISDWMDTGNVWHCMDSPTNTAQGLGTAQQTWSTLVINSAGTDGTGTKYRSNTTEVSMTCGVASSSQVKIGMVDDMHLLFAEKVQYSSSHLSGTMSAIQSILNSWIAPALLALMVVTVDSAIAGENPTTAAAVYSTANHATQTYVRNTACWGSGFVSALTPISPYNTDGGSHKAGVLISPRHVIFATHYTPATGSTLHFVKADGTCVTRTLSAVQVVTDTSTQYPDITIGKLDSDVSAGIDFARVLPTNFQNQAILYAAAKIPVICTNQTEDLLVFDLNALPAVNTNVNRMGWETPANAQRLAFNDTLAGGDSGSPFFWIIDSKMVLLGLATSTTGGTHVATWHTEINAAMATLGGGYTLTDIDLSSFGSY